MKWNLTAIYSSRKNKAGGGGGKFCINNQRFALNATPVKFLSGKAQDMILYIHSRPDIVELHRETSRAAYKPVLFAVPWI